MALPEEEDTTTAAALMNEHVTADIELAEKVVDNNDATTVHHNHDSIVANKHPNDLQWAHVHMTLKDKKGEIQQHILEDVWGEAKAGKTTAIIGASGAGKTSLFQTLAGRVSSGGKLTVQVDMYLEGIKINPMEDRDIRRLFAYVAQHDALHESSTAR
jgi:ABC-type transport system involved in cytochrome bd biosynthesis fused ATPase/permease subunit